MSTGGIVSTRMSITRSLLGPRFSDVSIPVAVTLSYIWPWGRCTVKAKGEVVTTWVGTSFTAYSTRAVSVSARTGTSVDEAYKEMVRAIPLGRYGEPHEVGSLAAFIASEKGAYLTGGMFDVDGGVISSVF